MKAFSFIKKCLFYIPKNIRQILIHRNYKHVISNLKVQIKRRKLIVCFLSTENSKWAYQSLYEIFRESNYFIPVVLVTLNKNYTKKDLENLRKNYEFFEKRGINVKYAFDIVQKRFIPIAEFTPDIVFFEEPWNIADCQSCYAISKRALCCYCSYGSGTTKGRNEYCSRVFKEVWRYFLDNDFVKNILIKHHVNPENLVVSGNIKLDAYKVPLNSKYQIWNTSNYRIIYAPHFSFSKDSILKFGTFDRYYKVFIEFAQQHPEIEFIFKPHPNLKAEIINKKLMTAKDVKEYYSQWEQMPNTHIYENGNYIDLFRASNLMITDCNSFLTEYLPTLNPLIRLVNENSVGLNTYGEEITKGYYNVHNLQELNSAIESIVFKKSDSLLKIRKKCLTKIIFSDKKNAQNIYDCIFKELAVSN